MALGGEGLKYMGYTYYLLTLNAQFLPYLYKSSTEMGPNRLDILCIFISFIFHLLSSSYTKEKYTYSR